MYAHRLCAKNAEKIFLEPPQTVLTANVIRVTVCESGATPNVEWYSLFSQLQIAAFLLESSECCAKMAAEPAQIHQADAWELLQQGGCILMSGAPAETIIGLDLAAWAVNTTFCGFKMVPPGPHFLSISCDSS